MSERDDEMLSNAIGDINAGRPYISPFSDNPHKKAIPVDGAADSAKERLPSNEIDTIADITDQVGMTIKRNGNLERF